MTEQRLLIFGLGYTARAIAAIAGMEAIGTSRTGEAGCIAFDAAEPTIATATHLLISTPPGPDGDPVLARYTAAIRQARHLRWIGYLSSTVVYGNRDGGWVDEDTPPRPTQPRGQRRVEAETNWAQFAARCPVDIFRLAGIYGPGRSAFDDLRAGKARRMIKPGHQFGRIHRDDIARAVVAAMRQDRPAGVRILNLSDDEPSESADVVTEAATLLGIEAPAPITFAEASPTMSPMALGFWAENRKVASRKTQQALELHWLYPTYREGLRAILSQERADRPA